MFENHLGLRENPFVAGHQPRFVYPSREHQEALAHLRFGIENREPFVLITGEVGTGKTTAIYDALHGWGTKAVVALITNSALTRAELLEEIALRFGLALPPAMSKPQAMVLLERHLLAIRERGELAILLLDEAQNLERELLEEIRLLSNLEAGGQKQMQIFLVGQPELEQKLARPELRQLRQRITVHYRLNPLSPEETERYIHHRVSVAGGNARDLFPHETCIAIYTLTHGIPREINTVCGQALINAYVDDSKVVLPDHVMTLARDTTFRSVLDVPAGPGDPPAVDVLLAAEAATVGPRPWTPPPPPAAPPAPVRTAPPAAAPPVAPPPASAAPPRPPVFTADPEPLPPMSEPLIADEAEPLSSMSEPAIGDETEPLSSMSEPVTDDEAEPLPPIPASPLVAEPYRPPMVDPDLIVEPEPEGLRMAGSMSEPPPPAPYTANRPPVFSNDPEPLPPLEETLEESIPDPYAEPEPVPISNTQLSTPWYGVRSETAPPAEPVRAPEPTPAPEFEPTAEMARDLEPAGEATPESEHAESGATDDVSMPAWLDEVIERKKDPNARVEGPKPQVVSARLPAPHIAPPKPPPIPARVPVTVPPRPVSTGLDPDFIPTRLREKLDAAEARRRGTNAAPWFIAAVLLAAVAVAMILMLRFGTGMPWDKKSAARPAAAKLEPRQSPTPVDSSATVTQNAAQIPATHAEPLPPAAAPATEPAPTRSEPVAVAAAPEPKPAPKPEPAKPAAPKPKRIYGIVVGTYFDESRAAEVASKAAAPLGLPTRTVAVVEDGAAMYQAVVGHFDDRARAESAAAKLAQSSKVGEARVVSLGTASK